MRDVAIFRWLILASLLAVAILIVRVLPGTTGVILFVVLSAVVVVAVIAIPVMPWWQPADEADPITRELRRGVLELELVLVLVATVLVAATVLGADPGV